MPSLAEPARWALPSPDSASGCFETMRVYRGRIFRLSAHLQRLEASAQYLGVRLSLTFAQLGRRLTRAVANAGIREAVVRVALIPACAPSNGAGRPKTQRLASPSIVVQPVPLPPAASYQRGIHVAVVPTRRFPVSQIDPQAKFSARLGSIQAVMEAQLRHADEAVFMDGLGSVTESTASNLGIIKDGVVLAPPCWLGLLAGVTWQVLGEAARELRVPVREAPLTRHDLYNANEAFLTSTLKEVLPVTRIDGRLIGTGTPGPLTQRLHRAFRRVVERELDGDR